MAVRLGYANVDRLLRSLTAKQFIGWEAYDQLEPFTELRQDYRIASIVQALYNVNRGKNQRPFTLEDVVVKFGDSSERSKPQTQTWEQKKALLIAFGQAFAVDAVRES